MWRNPRGEEGGEEVGMEGKQVMELQLEAGVDFMGKVSVTMEKLYIINLDVLSSVLYRWRSLEATVRIRLKTRGRRLKSKF